MVNQEQLEAYVAASIGGSKKATDFIIMQHMSYVRTMAKSYSTNPNDFDEMVSVGTCALVIAVSRLGSLDHHNYSGYLKKHVRGAINEAYRDRDIIHIPQTAEREDFTAPLVTAVAAEDNNLVDLEDALEIICETEQERAIVYALKHGFTQRQIAQKLDIAKSTVGNIRKRLYWRYRHVTK